MATTPLTRSQNELWPQDCSPLSRGRFQFSLSSFRAFNDLEKWKDVDKHLPESQCKDVCWSVATLDFEGFLVKFKVELYY